MFEEYRKIDKSMNILEKYVADIVIKSVKIKEAAEKFIYLISRQPLLTYSLIY